MAGEVGLMVYTRLIGAMLSVMLMALNKEAGFIIWSDENMV